MVLQNRRNRAHQAFEQGGVRGRGGGGRGGYRNSDGSITCYKCQQIGHIARNCTNEPVARNATNPTSQGLKPEVAAVARFERLDWQSDAGTWAATISPTNPFPHINTDETRWAGLDDSTNQLQEETANKRTQSPIPSQPTYSFANLPEEDLWKLSSNNNSHPSHMNPECNCGTCHTPKGGDRRPVGIVRVLFDDSMDDNGDDNFMEFHCCKTCYRSANKTLMGGQVITRTPYKKGQTTEEARETTAVPYRAQMEEHSDAYIKQLVADWYEDEKHQSLIREIDNPPLAHLPPSEWDNMPDNPWNNSEAWPSYVATPWDNSATFGPAVQWEESTISTEKVVEAGYEGGNENSSDIDDAGTKGTFLYTTNIKHVDSAAPKSASNSIISAYASSDHIGETTLFDSGASKHMTPNPNFLSNILPTEDKCITAANGGILKSLQEGTM
ncbi:hypothetical protein VNI00_019243 [Paramarasmius palmivorus]|uniref:CCHC-type domain-containing protein n=1 Tax=Paramarasmius palmivorus TaxID=297713 RepID=A0AAW0ANQ9_9AGAR